MHWLRPAVLEITPRKMLAPFPFECQSYLHYKTSHDGYHGQGYQRDQLTPSLFAVFNVSWSVTYVLALFLSASPVKCLRCATVVPLSEALLSVQSRHPSTCQRPWECVPSLVLTDYCSTKVSGSHEGVFHGIQHLKKDNRVHKRASSCAGLCERQFFIFHVFFLVNSHNK